MPQTRRLLRATLSALLLLAAACASVFLLLYLRREPPPAPTAPGWAAGVTTVAGDGSPGYADGPALGSRFGEPFGVAVDRAGNVYVADAGESNRIRKLTPEGSVTTLAGGVEGFADGAGGAASFNTPSGLAVDDAGNIYVADTGNNRIRKVTPEGVVTTVAGDGTAGFRDGPAAQARFDAPVGVAVDRAGNIYVADTYNDRIRLITPGGGVSTIAGNGAVGHADGDALTVGQLDTPCGVAVSAGGEVFIADTGNDRLRKLSKDGQLSTLPLTGEEEQAPGEISRPLGLAVTHDGFLYATMFGRGRVVQVAPDMRARIIAGVGQGFADGDGRKEARLGQPSGVALDRSGTLYVTDSANYLIRKVAPLPEGGEVSRPLVGQTLPRLPVGAAMRPMFPWPLDPQDRRHEVVATLGEVRGSYDTDDSRHHLHSGVDVFGVYGRTVRVVLEEKVTSPLPNWGFGGLNEGLRVGLISYIHQRVGRDERDEMLDGAPFVALRDEKGQVVRVRVRRGTRLRVGDALGTVNRMYHVHMNYGPPGGEVNPLMLPLPGFSDAVAPTIERDGIQIFDETGVRLTGRREGRLVLRRGPVRVVVDAFDRVDGNQERRRLGLYSLAFQILRADGTPAVGYEQPRVQLEFDRLPPDREATKIAYADESGITVYGSRQTRFLYELTNTVRSARAERGVLDFSAYEPGDYVLRVLASDLAGNTAEQNRDLPLRIE